MEKKEFVSKCGELLAIAKPNLVRCEYVLGKNIAVPELHKAYECYNDYDEYVVVTCENGYSYKINITANSFNAIAEAIFHAMAYK